MPVAGVDHWNWSPPGLKWPEAPGMFRWRDIFRTQWPQSGVAGGPADVPMGEHLPDLVATIRSGRRPRGCSDGGTFAGPRMFPTVRVSFSGPLRQITPADRYVVLLDVVPVDNRRYRYAYHRSAWLVAGKADPPPPPRLYAHPDTPIGADALRKQVISFEKVKLTNNEMDKNGQLVRVRQQQQQQGGDEYLPVKVGTKTVTYTNIPRNSPPTRVGLPWYWYKTCALQRCSNLPAPTPSHRLRRRRPPSGCHGNVQDTNTSAHTQVPTAKDYLGTVGCGSVLCIVLNSMHRYQPRIHLVRLVPGQNIPTTPKELQEVDHKTYVFPETIFTAVTAYQNQLITKLKIDSNPFAKGFRDSSRLTDFDR
ncbi:T-box protein H15 [Culex quinquefasciatus]|uniref:T-box protein H15 n=1 Tax=Culex quinquefasciatus TaxID=7176 RepID=B0WNB5_CULQU|nr:T-box protein H15 [Culex quinquefasciatus]|eukprot:XP_001850199.1 T-box protein H15 [Culex quinquefasciatus]